MLTFPFSGLETIRADYIKCINSKWINYTKKLLIPNELLVIRTYLVAEMPVAPWRCTPLLAIGTREVNTVNVFPSLHILPETVIAEYMFAGEVCWLYHSTTAQCTWEAGLNMQWTRITVAIPTQLGLPASHW